MKQTLVKQTLVLPTAILFASLIGGCSGPRTQAVSATQYPPATRTVTMESGVVDSIQLVQAPGAGSGVGAVVGGVTGGLLGNQVGGGSGRTAATAAGVIGGAVVGNQIERNAKAHEVYQIGIRLDSGGYQTVAQETVTDLRVGDRVRIENGRVYRL
jgi:outer membrane lipoprotein SlyB